MTPSPKGALHQVHTASNDVLEGDKTMVERAETEIPGSISDWTAMHTPYSMKLAALLSALGHGSADDRSYRGTLNSAVFIKRVWITGLDKGSMGAVRRGEMAIPAINDGDPPPRIQRPPSCRKHNIVTLMRASEDRETVKVWFATMAYDPVPQ